MTARTTADVWYAELLSYLLMADSVLTRNHHCRRVFAQGRTFHHLPLITMRKTAWRKALRELEWFLSGDLYCPEELKDWWNGQLSPMGSYRRGYGEQLRHYTDLTDHRFDQIDHLIRGLRSSPNSRRHILTTWHPAEMAGITQINDNPATPTTCHLSFVQFQVHAGRLEMLSVQRSADVLLGLPHNLMQHWALMTWLAHRADLKPGHLSWVGGDVHLYDEPSHLAAAEAISAELSDRTVEPVLTYTPSSDDFVAADFAIEWPDGPPSMPCWYDRPVLL
jgi:thymidylate synthase